MRKAANLTILFITMTLVSGCMYEEIDVPDICGIYTGARTYSALKDEEMSIDIKAISKKGIKGTITYYNTNQQYTTSFTGEWKECGSGADIYFYEKEAVEKVNVTSVSLCAYQGKVKKRKIRGSLTFLNSENYIYEYRAEKTPPEAEIPIEDPVEPVLPDYE